MQESSGRWSKSDSHSCPCRIRSHAPPQSVAWHMREWSHGGGSADHDTIRSRLSWRCRGLPPRPWRFHHALPYGSARNSHHTCCPSSSLPTHCTSRPRFVRDSAAKAMFSYSAHGLGGSSWYGPSFTGQVIDSLICETAHDPCMLTCHGSKHVCVSPT